MMNSGIYIIENILDHKKYIGSSKDLKSRKKDHLFKLRNNKHRNTHLQNAFNKYGEEFFEFYIVLFCNEDMLLIWEKKAFELFKCCDDRYGYNLRLDPTTQKHSEQSKQKISRSSRGIKKKSFSLTARKNLSLSRIGKTHSKEVKDKMSKSHSGKKLSNETKLKLSLSHTGKKLKLFSIEGRENMSIAHKNKPWSAARRLAYEKSLINNN